MFLRKSSWKRWSWSYSWSSRPRSLGNAFIACCVKYMCWRGWGRNTDERAMIAAWEHGISEFDKYVAHLQKLSRCSEWSCSPREQARKDLLLVSPSTGMTMSPGLLRSFASKCKWRNIYILIRALPIWQGIYPWLCWTTARPFLPCIESPSRLAWHGASR